MYIFVSVEKKQALPLNEHCNIEGSKGSSKVSAVHCVKSARIRDFLVRISRILTEYRDLRSKSYVYSTYPIITVLVIHKLDRKIITLPVNTNLHSLRQVKSYFSDCWNK